MRTFFLVLVAVTAIVGCTPEGYEYVPCTTRSDCVGSSDCHTITWPHGSGGLCTAPCGVDSECPHFARCADIEGMGNFLCYERCNVTADCPMTFDCQLLIDGRSVCLPGP